MAYHIERETAERVGQGMTPDEARRTALRDFGGVARHMDDARDVRGVRWLEETVRDAAYAARILRRNPAFTITVAATFALGIGAASAIFSLVDGILVRPLPYSQPGRLVSLWERDDVHRGGNNVVSVSMFERWRARATALANAAALVPAPLTLDGTPSERLKGVQVSPDYFSMLGVHPSLGRDFAPADETNGGAPVAILSDALWRSRYGGDPSIVGRRISIDGSPVTVIGVMPASFEPPRFGWIGDQPLWLPFSPTEDNRRWGRFLHVVARLRPGMTIERARGELSALSARDASRDSNATGWSANAEPLDETITGGVRTPIVVLFAAVALLLAIAAVNVGSLVTTFARGRQREIAIRRAIGATRGRLVRQQLMQSAVLGMVGTAAGLGLAVLATRALVALAPSSIPRLDGVRVDTRVLLFAIVVASATTAIFGVVAVYRAWERKPGTSTAGGSRLIAAEVAIGLVLSLCGMLMVRSFASLRAVDLGFDAASLAAGRVFLPSARYPDDARRTQFFADLIRRIRTTPGVVGASIVTTRPLACCAPATSVGDPSQAKAAAELPVTDIRFADESWFSTARIPVVTGHGFGADESATGEPRVVVSRALARAVWGDADPLGKLLAMGLYGGITARVIGVVGDVHLADLRTPIRPAAYLSTARFPSSERDVVVRGSNADAALAALRDGLRALDPSLPLSAATSLDAAVAETLAQDRFTTALLGSFAALSLVLAGIGVYGVLAGEVRRRRKEIGIRLALGSRRQGIALLVARRGLEPAVVGVAVGLAVALVLTRALATLVFGISTRDFASIGLASLVLLAVAAVAAFVPAVRASGTSPTEIIRGD
jgi:predicted permease